VTLVAPDVFAGPAAATGLEFASSGTVEEYEELTKNRDLWDPRRGFTVVLRVIVQYLRRAYAILERLHEPEQTMLVGHSLSFFTRVFEESHRVPAATVHLAPSIFRSEFKMPTLPSGQDVSWWPRWAKRTLLRAVDRFVIDPQIAPGLNAFRAELGLPPITRVFDVWMHSPQRVVGLFPDWFSQPQPDWPSALRLAGFVLSDDSCSPNPRKDDVAARAGLDRFLAAGEPPIVFTPGSANRHAAEFFRAAIDASARLHRRALLVTGYREHLPASLPAHARHVSYASFATLFPRSAAVVHHGGIGTCAQGLAAGVPQLVMPMGFDQPDNALRLTSLGVGEAIRPAQFTGERVAEALTRLFSSEAVAQACRECRDRIDSAAAVGRACDVIEGQFGAFHRPDFATAGVVQ
jgi:UDP:flavonoid glycosyltransferase YjiC (YdhE family)